MRIGFYIFAPTFANQSQKWMAAAIRYQTNIYRFNQFTLQKL